MKNELSKNEKIIIKLFDSDIIQECESNLIKGKYGYISKLTREEHGYNYEYGPTLNNFFRYSNLTTNQVRYAVKKLIKKKILKKILHTNSYGHKYIMFIPVEKYVDRNINLRAPLHCSTFN